MQKTLGGDRLGSGNKMKVDLHGFERSTHDLGYVWRSTMSVGTLVPFMCEVALPGDTFDINLGCEIMTHPTVGPLFGSKKVQLDVFQCPIRLYNALLHNNALKIGLDMSQAKLPVLKLKTKIKDPAIPITDLDNSQINPSSILSYLGIRGIGAATLGTPGTELERDFNGTALLSYWDIVKNYYSNKQEEIGAVIHTAFEAVDETIDTVTISGDAVTEYPTQTAVPISIGDPIIIDYTGTAPAFGDIYVFIPSYNSQPIPLTTLSNNLVDDFAGQITGTITAAVWPNSQLLYWRYKTTSDQTNVEPRVVTFDLNNLDEMREAILSTPSRTTPFDIFATNLEPYVWLQQEQNNTPNILASQEGLAVKTYQSDAFNNWLQTEWIEGPTGISSITAIDTSSGEFTIDTMILAKKVYTMLTRIAVSGGTYDDWMDAQWGEERYKRAETPMYMGGLIKELVFQEVVSNSQTAEQPLGTLAGRGVLANKHKGGSMTIKVDEPSYIIGIISLTPRLDYSQGNKWDTGLQTLNDLHVPSLDQIGFQDLITEKMAWWSTKWDNVNEEWIQTSAGKQPAWIDYMTNINQTRGNFAIADNEMFMTLNRRYTPQETEGGYFIQDLTTYIDPTLWNFIFADTALDAQNYWAQVAVDITARRKMSAKVMPNL